MIWAVATGLVFAIGLVVLSIAIESSAHARVVELLREGGGWTSVKLAKVSGLSRPLVLVVLDRLEDQGRVIWIPDAGDRRYWLRR